MPDISNLNSDRDGSPDLPTKTAHNESVSGNRLKLVAFGGLALLIVVAAYLLRDTISLDSLAARESELRQFQQDHPIGTYALAFVVYVAVTGLSLPGAAALTLVYGWYFGFARALLLVSFASTLGATLAFLSSRYLLRDAVESRYGSSMQTFQENLKKEGAFYLFTLRLIPAVPFFVINLVMGLTPIALRTYWWVSQLGMLPGTAVYVYAGSRVPHLEALAKDGAGAVFEPRQLTQILIAFCLLGLFPWLVRFVLASIKPKAVS